MGLDKVSSQFVPLSFKIKLSAQNLEHLIERLDEARHSFGPPIAKALTKTLISLRTRRFADAESLVRYHEILLFLRAYPQNSQILKLVEKELGSFSERVEQLKKSGADLSALNDTEVSGVAGTSVTDTFSYFIVCWLNDRHPGQIAFYWDWFEDENRLAATLPRFIPLLEEDAYVEANVPYREWLRRARGKEREIAWLLKRLQELPASDREKAELYDGLKLYVTWTPSIAMSRTSMRIPVRRVFYHRGPLIQRRDISFAKELESPPSALTKMNPQQGQRILDLARATSTLRYRELYGFTHGDPRRVLRTNLGRGVDLFIFGVTAGKRLPLRAYHAAMIFKNGVPIGYFEGLSLFERMESGFNLYYSFRDGETAWLYARTLNVFRHLLGVTTFTLDPYQVGHENEEGIESGAFWFYRKLGFRSADAELRKVTQREESKIRNRASYRTSARVLRQLATRPMIFELDKNREGQWDRFQVRNLGMAVQRRMAESYRGSAELIVPASAQRVTEALSIRKKGWRQNELLSFQVFALVMALIPDLARWTRDEKQLAVRIIKAKAGSDEAHYLRLMQRHARLRNAFIELGSL